MNLFIDEWMEKSRIWDKVSFLPRRYINSGVPAHIMWHRHFSHITFAAEVTYDRAFCENLKSQEDREYIRLNEVCSFEEAEREYEELNYGGPVDIIPDSGEDLKCIITLDDMYKIYG